MNFKKILIAAAIVAIIYLIARSCESSDTAIRDTEIANTEEADNTPELSGNLERDSIPEIEEVIDEPPSKPLVVGEHNRLLLGIVHSIDDLDSWMSSYVHNREEETRMAVYQNIDEEGHVFVLEQVEVADVEAFMEKGYGPQTYFFNAEYLNTEVGFEPYAIAVSYDIEEFSKWKDVFDSESVVTKRSEAGLNVWGYASGFLNPKRMYVLYTANSIEVFRKHMARFDLEFLKEEAGITSDLSVTFLRRLHLSE